MERQKHAKNDEMSLMETAAMCDRALDGQDGGCLNQWDVYCLSVCPLVT